MSGSPGGRLIRQRERAEVENFRVRDELFIHFFRGQTGIGARFTSEAEIPVPGRVQGNKGQRCKNVRVNPDPPGIYPGILQCFHQRFPEGVIADFSDHGSPAAVLCQRCQEIARRSARVGGQDRVACLIDGMWGKIDQQFTERNHVIMFHPCHSFSISEYFVTSIIT